MPPEKQWPEKVQKELVRLRNKRESAKSKLANAIDDRDVGLQEVAMMGASPSKGERDRCVDVVTALLKIKYNRVVIVKCANAIDKIIGEADQGKFDFADEGEDIPTEQMYLRELAAGKDSDKKESEPAGADAS